MWTKTGRGRASSRCVADSICHRSPWGQITGQIFLGSPAFRERRASLLPDQRAANVPRIQTDSTLLKGDEIMISVAAVYGISTTAMVACTHREAYQAAIWLLQSATNEPLNTVMSGLVCTITHACTHAARKFKTQSNRSPSCYNSDKR